MAATAAPCWVSWWGVLGAFYSSNSIAASDTLTSLGRPFVQVNIVDVVPLPLLSFLLLYFLFVFDPVEHQNSFLALFLSFLMQACVFVCLLLLLFVCLFVCF